MTDRLDQFIRDLEAERYGPVVHEPASIPHLPLAAGAIADVLREEDALKAVPRASRAAADRIGQRRRRGRPERVLTNEEAEVA